MLASLALLMTVLVAVDCSSWSQSANCNTDFRGSASNNKQEKDFTFPANENEYTFDLPKCNNVIGVKASACNEYPFTLRVMGPDSVYFSRSPYADGDLKIHVEVYCA